MIQSALARCADILTVLSWYGCSGRLISAAARSPPHTSKLRPYMLMKKSVRDVSSHVQVCTGLR